MRNLFFACLLLCSGTAFGATTYNCIPKDETATIATKHIKGFNLEVENKSITLSKMEFLVDEDGLMCESQPPKTATITRSAKNGAKSKILKDLIQFRAAKKNPLRTDTCFVSFNIYLPKVTTSDGKLNIRITWSDTDGDFPTNEDGEYINGGDTFICTE